MDIVKEQKDNLNALLKIKIVPEDYKKEYDKALATYKKQMRLPGFRPGHIPMGLVKKQYGRHVLAEELNKILSDSIHKYISENKLDVLGYPLPVEKKEVGDWDNPGEFEFTYEMGMAPVFKLKIPSRDKYVYRKIEVSEKMIAEEMNRMARRYGKLLDAEVSEEKDLLVGEFIELGEDGLEKEFGIRNHSSIALEFLENAEEKLKLTGLKKGDVVAVEPEKLAKGHDDMARLLGVTHEEVHGLHGRFHFKLNEVKRMEAHEINQELIDKIFKNEQVDGEQGFKFRIREQFEKMYESESDQLLLRDIINRLTVKNKISLPDEFLKKWIKQSSEKEIRAEDIEKDYNKYAKSLKWQLISTRILEENNLNPGADEIEKQTRELLLSNYAQYGMPAPPENDLKSTITKVLENRDEYRRVYDQVAEKKILTYMKENSKLSEKHVSYEQFVELAKAEN